MNAPFTPPAVPDDSLTPARMREHFEHAFQTVGKEYSDAPLPVVGSLPPAIDGVLFRNGPGRFNRGGVRYGHLFDGDGHLLRIDIRNGTARYSNRFVRTREYQAEAAAGRMCYRGFGSNLPGGLAANLFRKGIKNPANTNVVWHGGRLLALWEGGLPYRIDPHSLATLGPEDFAGQLHNPLPLPSRWIAPMLPFAAHPCRDAETGTLFNFGVVFGRPHQLALYRVDRDGQMATPQLLPLPTSQFNFIHDLAVTRRWLCVLVPHASFNLWRALTGLATLADSLQLDTARPMQALLIPRDPSDQQAWSGAPVQILEAVPGFAFHIAQSFDRDDGALVLDVIRYRRYPALNDLGDLFHGDDLDSTPRLERLILEPGADGTFDHGRCEVQPWPGPDTDPLTGALAARAAEFPTTAPGALGAPRRIIYSVGGPADRRGPYFTAIQRLDTETGAIQIRDFAPDLPGEPVWVPGQPGAAGWLLSVLCRVGEDRAELLVLDAADLSVTARLQLPHAIPPGFHGEWVARAELPAPTG